jgi:hypothetical protein
MIESIIPVSSYCYAGYAMSVEDLGVDAYYADGWFGLDTIA